MALPTVPLTDNRFKYRNSAQTDVRLTWAEHGWPFPAPGQIKRVATQNDRIRVENKIIRNESKQALADLGDALI